MNEGQEVPVLFCRLQEPEHLWWWTLSRDCRDSGLPFTGYVALGEASNFLSSFCLVQLVDHAH